MISFTKKKMSVGDLVKKAGIQTHILGRYMRGETTSNIDMVSKLADIFGVSVDYLVGKKDIEHDRGILDEVISIQKLLIEDKVNIMYSLDGLIQYAKNHQDYAHIYKIICHPF